MLLFTSLFRAAGGLPPPPAFALVGEPDGGGTCGSVSATGFQANWAFAQRYTTGHAGRIVALAAYLNGPSGTGSIRLSVYADADGTPGALLTTTGARPHVSGPAGWYEHELDPEAYLDVGAAEVVWIVVENSSSQPSCTPSVQAATALQRQNIAFGSGPPDPFASEGASVNVRGLRMRIWTNP